MDSEFLRLLDFGAVLVVVLAGLYLVVLPLVRFVHLLGHAAVGALVAGGATVRLGDHPRWTSAIGPVSVSVAPASGSAGTCEPAAALDGRRRLAFDLGGPAASLLSVAATSFALGRVADGTLVYLVVWAGWWLTTAQLVVSVAPTVVPSWWPGPYAGATSDLHDHYPKRLTALFGF